MNSFLKKLAKATWALNSSKVDLNLLNAGFNNDPEELTYGVFFPDSVSQIEARAHICQSIHNYRLLPSETWKAQFSDLDLDMADYYYFQILQKLIVGSSYVTCDAGDVVCIRFINLLERSE